MLTLISLIVSPSEMEIAGCSGCPTRFAGGPLLCHWHTGLVLGASALHQH